MAISSDSEYDAPLVSVIIPCYNVALFISEALESALRQTFTSFEIIVINDGSPDTPELEQQLSRYRNQIIYLKQENLGVSAARNLGIRTARGEYLAFLDGDDVWRPDFLKEQIKFIRSGGGYDLVYTDAYHFGNHCEGMTYMQTCPSEGEVNCESLLSGRCNVICSGVLVRRQAVLEVGLFDEEVKAAEDFDLWIRISKRKGAKLNYQRKILLGYRHRDGSMASDIDRQTELAIRVYEKIGKREDLAPSERAALERIHAKQNAVLATSRGKSELLRGNSAEAVQWFKKANDFHSSRKLRLLLKSVRLAPSVVQSLYKFARLRTQHQK